MGDDNRVFHGGQRRFGVAGAHQVDDAQHGKLVNRLACAAHQAQRPQRLGGQFDVFGDFALDLDGSVAGQDRHPQVLFNGF